MARSIRTNFLLRATYQVVLVLAPLLTTPYLARVLGPDQVGVYSFTYSITNYFVMFAVLGMSTYGVREIAACGTDRARRSRVFFSAYGSQLLVGAVVLAAYVAYALSAPQGGLLVCAVWGLWVLSALLDVSWLFSGVEEFKIPTLFAIATRVAGIVMVFAFVRNPGDLWIYVLSISGAFFLNQALIWPFVRRYVSFVRPTLREVCSHILPSLRLFIPVIAISLYTSMDKIMLGAMAGMEQAGFYEYSEKLSRMPLEVVCAMGTVMLPRMSTHLASGNRSEAVRLLGRSINVMLAMAFCLGFGIAAMSPEFAPVFLGDAFAECAPLMTLLACIIPLISITNVLGIQYLLPTKRDTAFTLSVCAGAVANIVVNVALIPRFGALGAAIGTVAAEVAVLAAQLYVVRGELPLRAWARDALPFVAMGLAMAVVIRLVAQGANALWGLSVQGLVLEVVAGVLAYGALFACWRALRARVRASGR